MEAVYAQVIDFAGQSLNGLRDDLAHPS